MPIERMAFIGLPSMLDWMLYTALAEKSTPTKAVTALTHFSSAGTIRSMSRMPIANRASSVTGSAST